MKTMEDLLLGQPKCGSSLIPHSFPHYFGTFITGHLIQGDHLMEVQLYVYNPTYHLTAARWPTNT